jgi:hypothetical protein
MICKMMYLKGRPRSTCSGSSLDENASVTLAVEQMQSQKAESVIVTRNGLAVGMVTDIVDKVVLKGEASCYYLCELVSCQARYWRINPVNSIVILSPPLTDNGQISVYYVWGANV